MPDKITGLVAAVHTPFHPDGSLNLDVVEKQAAHLIASGVARVFVAGSTGESHSLTVSERRALATRWQEVTRGTALEVIAHVGANCLADSASLAGHAQEIGIHSISALAPSYFKPRSVDALVDCCALIAGAAPKTRFYFYDIPVMTNVSFSMPEFLARGPAKIPNLVGLKFTNPDLMSFLFCLEADGGKWDVPYGMDEAMVAALATRAQGFVGSSFNFAAPIYNRLIAAFAKNDLKTARMEQLRSARVIRLLGNYGYMAAAKGVMGMLGVPVGPPRLPHERLDAEQTAKLRRELDEMGFFTWVQA